MNRELKEWKKGRRRSLLPAAAGVMLLVLVLFAVYAGGRISERNFQAGLLREFPGTYVITALIYQAGTEDVQGLSDAMGLPYSMEISENGGLSMNGIPFLEESEVSVMKVGQEEAPYEDAFGDFARENPLTRDGCYLILLTTEDGTAAFCYTDSRMLFTPDSISVYEIKKLNMQEDGRE